MGLRIKSAQLTDPGLEREQNQDACARREPKDVETINSKGFLYLVADGMGGQAAGDLASKMAAEIIVREYYSYPATDVPALLNHSIVQANREIYERASEDPALKGMGTTIVAAVLLPSGKLIVANAGDSRAYILRGGQLSAITQDHSFVANEVRAGNISPEEARGHMLRNVVTKALGGKPEVVPDINRYQVQGGDVVLLCSDGLHGVVEEDEIAQLAGNPNPERAGAHMIEAARRNGAPDNVTVTLVRISEDRNAAGTMTSSNLASHSKSAKAGGSGIPTALLVGLGLFSVLIIAALIVGIALTFGSSNSNQTTVTNNAQSATSVTSGPNATRSSPLAATSTAKAPVVAITPNLKADQLSKPVIYIAQPNDNLNELAKRFNRPSIDFKTTEDIIAKDSDKSNNKNSLQVGDKLKINIQTEYRIAYPVRVPALGKKMNVAGIFSDPNKKFDLEVVPGQSFKEDLEGKEADLILLLDKDNLNTVRAAFYRNATGGSWHRFPLLGFSNEPVYPMLTYVWMSQQMAEFIQERTGTDPESKATLISEKAEKADIFLNQGFLGRLQLVPNVDDPYKRRQTPEQMVTDKELQEKDDWRLEGVSGVPFYLLDSKESGYAVAFGGDPAPVVNPTAILPNPTATPTPPPTATQAQIVPPTARIAPTNPPVMQPTQKQATTVPVVQDDIAPRPTPVPPTPVPPTSVPPVPPTSVPPVPPTSAPPTSAPPPTPVRSGPTEGIH